MGSDWGSRSRVRIVSGVRPAGRVIDSRETPAPRRLLKHKNAGRVHSREPFDAHKAIYTSSRRQNPKITKEAVQSLARDREWAS